jgi:MscS family membrane protein
MSRSRPGPLVTPLVLALLLGSTVSTLAQMGATPMPSAPADAPASTTTTAPTHELASDSPAASVRAFLEAAGRGRWDDAGRYLVLPASETSRRLELAERLKGVLDSRRLVDFDTLSGESTGKLDDGLAPQIEQLAVLALDGTDQPLRLVRTADAQGAYWAFSQSTMSRVDGWYEALPDRWIRDRVAGGRADFLLRDGPFSLLWWQFFALPVVALLSWAAGRLLRMISRPLLARITSRTSTQWDDAMVARLGPPITLAFALLVFALGCTFMQLTRPAYQWVGALLRGGLSLAFFWALWNSIAVFVAFTLTRPWARANPSTLSLLTVGSNILRGAIIAVGALGILAAIGYPVGTLLAGLGIGGLALAFGAQKTIENVFGSMSLAVDQPLRVGDFVKVEDFVGTVEDIGLRSTRFRTLDRTVVSIPNGRLAEMRLESFQLRDRMRLATTVGLTYDTTREQMQAVLAGLTEVLASHPKIWPDAMVVKFKEFGASSLDIEVMAWFQVPTWGEFQVCREEVLLEFMRVVEEAGSSFAFPTQTVHLVKSPDHAAPPPEAARPTV